MLLSRSLLIACALGISALLPAQESLTFEEANRRAQIPTWLSLKYGAFDTRGQAPDVPDQLTSGPVRRGARGYFLVQLSGPVRLEDKAALLGEGVELLDYVPNNAFIVRATTAQLDGARQLAVVVWTGPFHPAYRVDPALLAGAPAQDLIVHFFAGVTVRTARQLLAGLQAEAISLGDDLGKVAARLHGDGTMVRALLTLPDVQWVQAAPVITLRNDTTSWVIQTNQSNNHKIWNQGLHGEGQIAGLIDNLIYMSSCYFDDPSGSPIGPNHRKVVYRQNGSAGGHGTHTAGTIAGDAQPVNGSTSIRGMAYLSRLASSKMSLGFSSFNNTASTHMNNGASVHSNSWGNDGTKTYDSLCYEIDLFQWNNPENLVLFAETNTLTLKNPENAKNLVAVGATQNGTSSGNFCTGGVGPTTDGRRKPEMFAPGCSIVSARSGQSCSTRTLTGTSMACPAVAGASMLIRQYFMDGYYPSGVANPNDAFTPSGALVKAVLLNGGRDLIGISGYPSDGEGWGRVHLDESLFFAGDTEVLVAEEVVNSQGLSTGQKQSYQVSVFNSTTPLEITMAFHDFPGTVNAFNPVINDLDLVVTDPSGTVYRGNVFSGGWSVAGGSRDAKNNVERVLVQQPTPGSWIVEVEATNVPQFQQGFGLAVSGQLTTSACPAIVVKYGVGKNGILGEPAIDSANPPLVGGSWAVNIALAHPGKLVILLMGLQKAAIPFDGGTILVQTSDFYLGTASAISTVVFPFQVPNDPGLCGLHVYFQAAVQDDPFASGQHWAATRGLDIAIGQ